MATRTEVHGEGFVPSPGLSEAVSRITALNVFARAFRAWAMRRGKGASISFQGHPDGSVEVDLGLPPGSAPGQADELLEIIEQCQRMADLEAIVSEMKHAGVSPDIVQNYVVEAEAIAHRLFGRGS